MATPPAPIINWVSRDTNNYITISIHQSWASDAVYVDAYDDDNPGNGYWTGVYDWYYPGANDFTISFGWDSKYAISDQDYTYFRVRARDGSTIGPWSNTSSTIYKYYPPAPENPSWGGYTSYTTTSCQIAFYAYTNDYYVNIYCNGQSYNYYTYGNVGWYYYTINNLSAGSSYTVYLTGYSSGGQSSSQYGYSIQTLYEAPAPNYGSSFTISPDGGYLYPTCTDVYGWGLEYDVRYLRSGSWTTWVGTSTPVHAISTSNPGEYIQLRCRYANPSSQYQKATSTSSWGWAYSNQWYRNTRPSNFSWTYTKVSGGTFNLTATEWNSFRSRIDSFRCYKVLSVYSYSNVSTGASFYGTDFTTALDKLNDMVSLSVYSHYTGDPIYASYLNDMVTAINSIS